MLKGPMTQRKCSLGVVRVGVGILMLGGAVGACERRTVAPGAMPAPARAAAPAPAPADSAAAPGARAAIDAFRRPDELVAALALRPGEVVGEVGAGGGYLTPRLGRAVGPTGRILATDTDAQALAALRTRVAAAGLQNVTTTTVAADAPGLPAGCCDLVLLAQVDHLLPERTAYLRALAGTLRPGGRIAVSNREMWREPLIAAARAAGYSVEEGKVELPAQYLVILRRPKGTERKED